MEFTEEQQAYIDQLKTTWETEVLAPITAERDELLQFKPAEKSDAEKALEQREAELFKKEIDIELKANNLNDFSDLLNVSNTEELKTKVTQLTKILDARKLNNSFQPKGHKQTDKYSQAKAQGDTRNMIKSIFGLN
ncbi:hypothetical protein [Paenibacillus durus]|uniref:Uncharacterized protein n=1 Tax=Paenibacillus durus ATCC 35681 TaxID=1333534 RepID=A0A0F7CJ48_PAEDU|nr:hypothetical protein [Paenibacillus durus]AKG35260.1 hypothetical protein VK70_12295 [Paenibacillus durus ATCC 35681]